MSAVLALLTSFASSMLAIWGDVVEFITTSGNEICLVGLIAWLFVMGTSGILRIVKN